MDAGKVYDETAVKYDLRSGNPFTEWVRRAESRIISRHARRRILDAGCGTGYHLRALRNAEGVDVSEEMVKLAKKTGKPVQRADIEDLPFSDCAFDTVLCMYSVLNVCDWREAIRELCRVTMPDGRIIISVTSIYDKGYKSLAEKERVMPGRHEQSKKFHIEGRKLWMHLFTRRELENEFFGHGFVLEEFDSVFRRFVPHWGLWKRLSLRERLDLATDWIWPAEYGCMYLMVFRGREEI